MYLGVDLVIFEFLCAVWAHHFLIVSKNLIIELDRKRLSEILSCYKSAQQVVHFLIIVVLENFLDHYRQIFLYGKQFWLQVVNFVRSFIDY